MPLFEGLPSANTCC